MSNIHRRKDSFEVRFDDSRPSRYFYFDDTRRRLNPDKLDSERALEAAEAFAGVEQDKLK
jgi:hypothetical protein